MRNAMFFSLVVVIASLALVTTPVAAVTIDDFSADHSFLISPGGAYTTYVDDGSIVTGQRDVTVTALNGLLGWSSGAFQSFMGQAYFANIDNDRPSSAEDKGNSVTGIDLIYDGVDNSGDINVDNTPFDITEGGSHDRFLVDVFRIVGEVEVILAFSAGLESEIFTMEKVIAEPGTYAFEFEDFMGPNGMETPSLASFFAFRAQRIGPEEYLVISNIYTGIGVPEPSSFALVALGITILCSRRRRTC